MDCALPPTNVEPCSTPSTTRRLRISLQELLILVAFIALGCAALKYANDVWCTILAASVLLLVMAAAVAALVDRGRRQAMAIGFTVCAAIYGVAFWAAPLENTGMQSRELDPYTGRLPTTTLLKPIFEGTVRRTWYDFQTGQELPNYDPQKPQTALGAGGGPYFFASNIGSREFPDRGKFMTVGHWLWVLLVSYCGARFAEWLFLRRQKEEVRSTPHANSTSVRGV